MEQINPYCPPAQSGKEWNLFTGKRMPSPVFHENPAEKISPKIQKHPGQYGEKIA